MQRFSQFYRTNYSLALAVAQRRLPSLDIAEEVVAEVFTIAWEKYRQGADLSVPWLYMIVRNAVGNQYQRQQRSEELIDRVGLAQLTRSVAPEAATPEVSEALALLTDDQQELITMVYWDELTTAEVAVILDCNEGAVRGRLHRARRALVRALDQTQLTANGAG